MHDDRNDHESNNAAMQRKPALHKSTNQYNDALDASMLLLLLWLSNGVTCLVDKTLRPHKLKSIVDGIQLGPGCTVRVEVVVAPGKVLTVVDGKVHVVQGVVSGTVDELLGPVARDHVAIMDEDSPDLHSNEEDHVEIPVHGAEEYEGASHVLVDQDVAVHVSDSYWYGSDCT